MRKAVIIDIDGTLANIEHRRHFVTKPNSDWRSFNESMVMDTVNGWCKWLIDSIAKTDVLVILVSGRGEEYRPHTQDWLDTHQIQHNKLFMRPAGDYRADNIIKKEIYDTKIKNEFNILFVIDDRKKVVETWRKLGLVCLQCCEGDY